MSLSIFASKIQQYCRLSGYSRKALALALGLHPTVLSHKLNATANRSLTYPEIKAIVKTLAQWEAITAQDQALELLALVDCPTFTQEEWRAAPLNRLEATRYAVELEARGSKAAARQAAQTPFNSENIAPDSRAFGEGLMVGRTKELGTLAALYRASCQKQSQVVVIAGEAGIGKSHLAAAFSEWAAAQGAEVLKGRAFEVGGRLPYQPLVEVLRHRLEQFSGLDKLLSKTWLGELSRLLPELRDRYPGMPVPGQGEGEARTTLFEAVTRLVQALANQTPVLLYLDDIQWADAVTLDLLHYAGRRWHEANNPILLLLTLRTEALATTTSNLADWLTSLAQSSALTRLELNRLNREDTLHLVQHLLQTTSFPESETQPKTLLENFGLWLYRETDGQPFFIIETLKALVEQGWLTRSPDHAGGWSAVLEIAAPDGYFDEARLRGLLPNGVREVVHTRLAELSQQATQLLVAGAVLGQNFNYEQLCGVSGLGESEGLVALDELLTAMLLREVSNEQVYLPTPNYIFAHDKIREVVYQEAGAARKQVFHRRALQTLKANNAPAATLAHHALAAGKPEEAFGYNIAAGDEARRLFANVQARWHYSHGLQVLKQMPDTEENRRHKVDTIMKQAIVSIYAVAPQQSLELLAEAETLAWSLPGLDGQSNGDRQRLARIHSWLSGVYYLCGRMKEAVSYSEQVLEVAQATGDKKLAAISKSVIGRALGTQGYFGRAKPNLLEAQTPLQELNNPTEWIYNLSYLATALAATGEWQAGLAEGQRALERARQTQNYTTLAHAYIHLCLVYYMAGDTARMLEESYGLLKAAEQSEDRLYLYIGYSFRAWAETRLGQFDVALSNLAKAKAFQRRLGQQVLLDDWVAAIEAELALKSGRIEEALRLAQAAASYATKTGGVFAEGLAHHTYAQALTRERGQCDSDSYKPEQTQLPAESWASIEAELIASLKAFEEGELVLEGARLHLMWGLMCRDKGDGGAAKVHLEQALAQFEARQLPGEAMKARQLLESLNQE